MIPFSCIECNANFNAKNPPACKLPVEIELKDGSSLFLPNEETIGVLCGGCMKKLMDIFKSHFPSTPIRQVLEEDALGGDDEN